jgi:hypothetical protein
MRGGPQLYNLWTEKDRLVVPVLCPVIESNLFSHPPSCGARLGAQLNRNGITKTVKRQATRGSCCCKATLIYQSQEPYRFRSWIPAVEDTYEFSFRWFATRWIRLKDWSSPGLLNAEMLDERVNSQFQFLGVSWPKCVRR